jgi:hypothetical protein
MDQQRFYEEGRNDEKARVSGIHLCLNGVDFGGVPSPAHPTTPSDIGAFMVMTGSAIPAGADVQKD